MKEDRKDLFLKTNLSNVLPGFEVRKEQLALSSAIEKALSEKKHLVAEAGTGVGKTLAYLLPSLLTRKKIYISTATKHLQDQLFFKDIPIAEKAIRREVNACLLKGRANYLCHHRFKQSLSMIDFTLSKKQLKKINKIDDWLNKTETGDLSEITSFVDEDYIIISKITATKDNCLGKDCKYYESCFYKKARNLAKKADVVVVNHALLMADAVLKEDGFGEILPDAEIVIVDEAHRLNQSAIDAFSRNFGSHNFDELLTDLKVLISHENISNNEKDTLIMAIKDIEDNIYEFIKLLQKNNTSGEIYLGAIKKSEDIYDSFKLLLGNTNKLLTLLSSFNNNLNESLVVGCKQFKDLTILIKNILISNKENKGKKGSESIKVLRWGKGYFSVVELPIFLGNQFQDIMDIYAKSWVFLSATLAINNSFDYFCLQMGMDKDKLNFEIIDSPFDYENQAVMHVMKNLPDSRDDDFIKEMLSETLPIIKEIKGRTFILFTSHKSLQKAISFFKDNNLNYFNIFSQGDLPKAKLVEKFSKTENSILLGTKSFWEGVDVRGDSLSCIIVDKIPFPSPGEIKTKAEEELLKKQGRNSFSECYIPIAATWLKQGVGRLIRSKTDRGIIIFADKRLKKMSYGNELLSSLPCIKEVDKNDLIGFAKSISTKD